MKGHTNSCLRWRAELEEALRKSPTEFDFFQVLRRLECAYRDRPRLGESVRPAEEPVRLEGGVATGGRRFVQGFRELAGDARHVGLGTDFDGGFGAESAPAEIDTVADLGKVGESLKMRGYAHADVEAILSGNWLRLLRRSLP